MNLSIELERLPISLVLTHDGKRRAFFVYAPTVGNAVAVMRLMAESGPEIEPLSGSLLRSLLATFMPRRAAHLLAMVYHPDEMLLLLGSLFDKWMAGSVASELRDANKKKSEGKSPSFSWNEAVSDVAYCFGVSPHEIWHTWSLPFFISMMREQSRLLAMDKLHKADLFVLPHMGKEGADAALNGWRAQAGFSRIVEADLDDKSRNSKRDRAIRDMFYSITTPEAKA